MKLKHLESALCQIPNKSFPETSAGPKIELEQYATPPNLASHVLISALQQRSHFCEDNNEDDNIEHKNTGDIGSGKSVLDLGCGTGILGIGSAIIGSDLVVCVDCDQEALDVAKNNATRMGFVVSPNKMKENNDDDNDEYDENDNDYEDENEEEYCDVGEWGDCRIEFILAKIFHHAASSNRNDGEKGGRGRGRGDRGRGRKKGRGSGRDKRGRGENRLGIRGANHNHNDSIENQNYGEGKKSCSNDDDNNNNYDGIPLRSNCVDTVLTNPPFGTKCGSEGIDMAFLRCAVRLAKGAVYSFHKRSTRNYVLGTAESCEDVVDARVVAEMQFELPRTYAFHKEKVVSVDVDLVRLGLK